MKFIQRYISVLFVFHLAFSTQVIALENDVVFKTNMGSFTLELFPTKAPKTVANFLTYVDDGYYDGTIFHRVIKDFIIQGGGFEKGMKHRETRGPVKNESDNRLKNKRGTISLARRTHPDTGTSQFYINLADNKQLDWKSKVQPGYTVFGKIVEGMDVIDKMAEFKTHKVDRYADVPKKNIHLISIKRKESKLVKTEAKAVQISSNDEPVYVAGEHYVVLDNPIATRDSSKVEVIEMFSYGCPHCYEFEPLVKQWGKAQDKDVDFWYFPAVWNNPMKLLAKAFYVAHELNVADKVHMPLFSKVVLEQQSIRNMNDLADLFESFGVDRKVFSDTYNSKVIDEKVKEAEQRVKDYKPVGVPEIVINGKYRIDRMHAGGPQGMLEVSQYLINKERAALKK